MSPTRFALFAYLLSTSATAQLQQTLPAGFETTGGNQQSALPFLQTARQRYHWVYDSAQFAAQQPIVIKEIAFRPPPAQTSWGPATYENLELNLAISLNDYRRPGYRRGFECNYAAPSTNFFRGTLSIPAGTHTGTGVAPWTVVFSNPTGFLYDPSQGRDLIIELRTPAGISGANPLLHQTDTLFVGTGSGGGASYVNASDPDASVWLLVFLGDLSPILRITYDLAPGLTADFGASKNVVRVGSPVTFTDLSCSDQAGGVRRWEWDFDSDGTVDSLLQHPTHVYAQPGLYSVSLQARDGVNPTAVTQRQDLIRVAGPTANTLSAEVLSLQFNEVRGRTLFNAASTTLAPASCFVRRTGWQGDPGRSDFAGSEAGFGCFGIDHVFPYENVVETQHPFVLDGALTISWWQRMITAPGASEAVFLQTEDESLRILTGGSVGQFVKLEAPGAVQFSSGPRSVQNQAGAWVHVALILDNQGGSMEWVIDGTTANSSSFPPGSLDLCSGSNILFGGGEGANNASRYYELDDLRIYDRAIAPRQFPTFAAELATCTLYDQPCPGPLGNSPQIAANGPPAVGNQAFAIRLFDAEVGRPAVMVMGLSTHVGGLFPLDVSGPFGLICSLGVLPDLSFPLAMTFGRGELALPIPADPALAGGDLYAQGLVFGTFGAITHSMAIHAH